jgi:hypothetical protein
MRRVGKVGERESNMIKKSAVKQNSDPSPYPHSPHLTIITLFMKTGASGMSWPKRDDLAGRACEEEEP